VTRLRGALVPLAIAGLTVLATLPLARIYHGRLLTWLLLGAAVTPVAISTVLRRLPAYPVAPISVAVLGGYTLLAVRLSAQDGVVLWNDDMLARVRAGGAQIHDVRTPREFSGDDIRAVRAATCRARSTSRTSRTGGIRRRGPSSRRSTCRHATA